MHQHNCFLLAAISDTLNDIVSKQYLVKCFSNTIDEIYFEFNNSSFRCVFYKGELFFNFENEIIVENRLFKPQFKELLNQRVTAVVQHSYERSFHIEFENNHQLVFKCFGRKSNVILFKDNKVSDCFRKHIETDMDLNWDQLKREIIPLYNPEFLNSKSNFSIHYPYLPDEFYDTYLIATSNVGFSNALKKFNKARFIEIHDVELKFNLNDNQNNVLSAISTFTSSYLKNKIFKDQKTELGKLFIAQLNEKENYFNSTSIALEKLKGSRKDEEIGNIILANLHIIVEGNKKIIVNDVYYNKPIEIKMDEKLSALKNAEAYFKKDKAKPHILKQLENKIKQTEIAIKNLKEQLSIVEKATTHKDLKIFLKTKNNDKQKDILPYKYFKIEDYDVLVGKHAESNEKLLNYFSDKDDIWMHAKDVGGSHVIIKTKKNKTLPEHILEKAASLAAYFSKSRQQTLATVAYTQRKFVRKIKGAEKGKVTISQEKTILVKPEIPS